jgi:transposase-like protein
LKKNRLKNHDPKPTPSASRNGQHRPDADAAASQPEDPQSERQDPAVVGDPERRGASRSEAPRSAGAPTTNAPSAADAEIAPDPEVTDRPRRRTFTAEYKARILREADECGPGETGALLRREGLYSSHLTEWRRQREAGELDALTPKKRGRKAKRSEAEVELERLRKENARLQDQIRKAELIISVQKKVAKLFGAGDDWPNSGSSS